MMRFDIRSMNFPMTPAIEGYVARTLERVVRRNRRHLAGGTVRLSDVNAERGGVDKECRVFVWLRHGGTITIKAAHADLYAAIDQAAHKLSRALRSRISRRRTLRRHVRYGLSRVFPPIEAELAWE
jgi:ribosomal subunit interface protein